MVDLVNDITINGAYDAYCISASRALTMAEWFAQVFLAD